MSSDSKLSTVPSLAVPSFAVPSFAVPSFAVPPPLPAAATRLTGGEFSESMLGKLWKLLGGAIDDATTLEVNTYTSSAADSTAGAPAQPLQNMRLRATTRVKIDGDTQVCVPVLENGQPDETLWKIHNEIAQQARADRKETIAMVVQMLHKMAPGGK